jgi:NAD(P)-dependent dehydrogenase (short-subunit alcohol dehydrogenase family)
MPELSLVRKEAFEKEEKMFTFTDEKVALITGGTAGIGFGIAEVLEKAGCKVIATGTSTESVETARQAADGKNIEFVKADVTNDVEIKDLVASLERLDILVNNAGIVLGTAADLSILKEYQIENFLRVLDVNLIGLMKMCLLCYPHLKDSGDGSIVNMSSIRAYWAGPHVPAYCASKGGVVSLTKALAAQWAKDNIRVHSIAPGCIRSRMTTPIQESKDTLEGIVNKTPMKRMGTPEDIGKVVLFFCSDLAQFVTGQTLIVDGGLGLIYA